MFITNSRKIQELIGLKAVHDGLPEKEVKKKLMKAVSISEQYLSLLLGGKHEHKSLDRLNRVKNFFGINTIDELMTEIKNKKEV